MGFQKKTNMKGNKHTYKAQMVANGITQKRDIDYNESFLLVVMLKFIRIILAIVIYYGYEIQQENVKTVFLNGNLTEDVYMTQPNGFVLDGQVDKVCKVQKFIYGLKQALRNWNIHFDQVVCDFNFVKNKDEPFVYKTFLPDLIFV